MQYIIQMVFNHDVDDCMEAFKELSNQMWHERHMNAFIHVKKVFMLALSSIKETLTQGAQAWELIFSQ